ncbi:MAG: substrate-binding domain-containing protein, partial [bacterium]
MHVLALLLALIASFMFAPGDARCADACEARYGKGQRPLTLATGSPGELGLLSALTDGFAPREDATLCWVKAGTGKALDLLRDGKVDLIMVHAPAAEKKAVADGW